MQRAATLHAASVLKPAISTSSRDNPGDNRWDKTLSDLWQKAPRLDWRENRQNELTYWLTRIFASAQENFRPSQIVYTYLKRSKKAEAYNSAFFITPPKHITTLSVLVWAGSDLLGYQEDREVSLYHP
jgi:hypothetical protein